jgi:hypothetical protein
MTRYVQNQFPASGWKYVKTHLVRPSTILLVRGQGPILSPEPNVFISCIIFQTGPWTNSIK